MEDEVQSRPETRPEIRPEIRPESTPRSNSEEVTIPVVEEKVQLAKKKIATGRVRLRKDIVTTKETAREPVLRERVSVERIEINQPVEQAPSPRVEGDTTIIPVVEEVIEVRKRLILREEIRIRKQVEQATVETDVDLRKERVQVDRLAADEEPREEGEESWTKS